MITYYKVIQQAQDNATKSYQEADIAKEILEKTHYWESRFEIVNLSMPESVEYFEYLVAKRKAHHKDLLENPSKREHSMSLQYAKKDLNEAIKNLEIATKLWK